MMMRLKDTDDVEDDHDDVIEDDGDIHDSELLPTLTSTDLGYEALSDQVDKICIDNQLIITTIRK